MCEGFGGTISIDVWVLFAEKKNMLVEVKYVNK